MYSLGYTIVAAPTTAQVAAFKDYIGVSGTATDTMLTALLKEAMLRVGEMHDVSLLACTCILAITDLEDRNPIKLYGTPQAVSSVKDAKGNTLAYQYTAGGKFVELASFSETAIVTYTTAVTALADNFQSEVWDYARKKYDNEK